jgi:beta-phosphoglucomutase
MLKAVIFDLDGILCDTSKYHARAWEDLVRELGHEPPADLEERVKGISRLASLRIALGSHAARYGEEQLAALAERKNDGYLNAIRAISPADVFAGVPELFADLRRAGIRIVLGSASKNARTVLGGLGLAGAFDAVADGHSYRHGKPHPDVFVTGARMAGAEPRECIVVEDAAAGIDAALDGGFVTVGMGAEASLRHAHRYVRSLRELDAASLVELHDACRSDRWTVVRDGADPAREGSYGTLFCVGNGFLGVRGSLPGRGDGIYAAGFYDRVNRGPQEPERWSPFTRYWGVPELARDDQVETCLVTCPDFLALDLAVDGEPLDWASLRILRATRRIDMRAALFTAEVEYESPSGRRFALTMRRFADAVCPERVFSQYVVEPLNFSGRLTFRSRVDGTTASRTYGNQSLYEVTGCDPAGERGVLLRVRGRHDGMQAAFGASFRALGGAGGACRVRCGERAGEIEVEAVVEEGKLLYAEHVAVAAIGRQAADARRAIEAAERVSFGEARIASAAKWRGYWSRSDVRVDGSPADQRAVRFSLYHLLLSAPSAGPGVSIAAKGLSGDVYRGMVFWDTDIHMTPFFNFTQPAMAKNLAVFRYLTLDGARRKAAEGGFRGANYPWETGVSGREECEKWLRLVTHQPHITADVAYALQEYADVTGDTAFYEDCAAEVLVETARFWMSKARENADGTLSIPGGGGPDEFHVVCDDSAYVLHMAAHNLRLADRAVRHLKEKAPEKLVRLLARTGATEVELARFAPAAGRLRTMRRPDGLIEQCEGFFALRDEVDPHEGGPRPFETQGVKQADVVMLLYLLPDVCGREATGANYAYYEPRTLHASSLSHAAHAIVAARLGLAEAADAYLRRSLGMDLRDEMGNAAQGAHMAAHGLNWAAIVRGFAGCRPRGDAFRIESPLLPAGWTRLRFRLLWRGSDFEVDLTEARVAVRNRTDAQPLRLQIGTEILEVAPGGAVERSVNGRHTT